MFLIFNPSALLHSSYIVGCVDVKSGCNQRLSVVLLILKPLKNTNILIFKALLATLKVLMVCCKEILKGHCHNIFKL